MSIEDAEALFGGDAVRRALASGEVDPVDAELTHEVERRAVSPGAFRAWALAQPWPRFCAIVRIASGVAARELLDDGED